MLLRVLACAAVVTSAWVHFDLWQQGFRDIDVIGPAFMVNAVAGVVIGIMLLAWRHWLPCLLAAGFGAATLGAFVISTLPNGLFGVHERWQGGSIWAGAISEAAAIVLGLLGTWWHSTMAERRARPY